MQEAKEAIKCLTAEDRKELYTDLGKQIEDEYLGRQLSIRGSYTSECLGIIDGFTAEERLAAARLAIASSYHCQYAEELGLPAKTPQVLIDGLMDFILLKRFSRASSAEQKTALSRVEIDSDSDDEDEPPLPLVSTPERRTTAVNTAPKKKQRQ